MDVAGQYAMEAADKSRTKGIIEMLTVVSDPPRAGGVKAAPEVGDILLVPWPEGPHRERVLEEAHRFRLSWIEPWRRR